MLAYNLFYEALDVANKAKLSTHGWRGLSGSVKTNAATIAANTMRQAGRNTPGYMEIAPNLTVMTGRISDTRAYIYRWASNYVASYSAHRPSPGVSAMLLGCDKHRSGRPPTIQLTKEQAQQIATDIMTNTYATLDQAMDNSVAIQAVVHAALARGVKKVSMHMIRSAVAKHGIELRQHTVHFKHVHNTQQKEGRVKCAEDLLEEWFGPDERYKRVVFLDQKNTYVSPPSTGKVWIVVQDGKPCAMSQRVQELPINSVVSCTCMAACAHSCVVYMLLTSPCTYHVYECSPNSTNGTSTTTLWWAGTLGAL